MREKKGKLLFPGNQGHSSSLLFLLRIGMDPKLEGRGTVLSPRFPDLKENTLLRKEGRKKRRIPPMVALCVL